jgi:hypothetical protein
MTPRAEQSTTSLRHPAAESIADSRFPQNCRCTYALNNPLKYIAPTGENATALRTSRSLQTQRNKPMDQSLWEKVLNFFQ